MNLARFSINRPIFASMLTLMAVVLGLVALDRLQIDLLPSIELPTITVRTQYEGADPVVMERRVTQIVEEITATVPGIEELTSNSYESNSRVRVRFGWGSDIDKLALDVQATLEDEISELPDGIRRPRVSKFDVDSFPVVILGISGDLDPVELTDILENQLRYRFTRLPGVAQVDPWGGFNRELRIELDPQRLNTLQQPLDEVLDAIKNANIDLPAGKIEQGKFQVTLRTPASFGNLQQILDTVIARRDGELIRLQQVASVYDTYEKPSRIIRVNGEHGVRVAIRKQAGANTVEVARAVLDEVGKINRQYPQIQIVAVTNQGNFIERAIQNLAQAVAYGGALAVLVLLFFLRNLRSTLVISLSIPISIIASFALLYFGGLTINLMTLGGLALGVGMMVDSSVVVLENIFRQQQEQAKPPVAAAIDGSQEVGSAIIAGTLTTLVIFLPLIFVDGVAGLLFKELAYVIMFSLFCALLVALSLVPALSARLLRTRSDDAPNGFASRLAGRILGSVENSYLGLLSLALQQRTLTVLLSLLLFVASLNLSGYIGTEFIPPSDEGEVRISGEMEVGSRLDLLDDQTRLLEQAVYPLVPEAVSSVVSVTASGTRGSAKAKCEIRLTLAPATQRERSNTTIARDLRRQLNNQIPGIKIRVRAPKGEFLLNRILPSGDGLSVEVRGHDLATLALLGQQASRVVEQVDGVSDAEFNPQSGLPQQEIRIDRDRVADQGLSVRAVSEVIETAVAGSSVGEYRVDGNSYRILVQLADAERRSLDEILNLTLNTASGNRVALRSLVSTEATTGPVTIERKDQQRLITIKANISDRDLGSVAADIQRELNTIVRPPGYDFHISGSYQEQQKSYHELTLALILALALVYMVLAAQYESLIDPLIVMLSVPLAAIGVIVVLFVTDTTLNLQSGIGCIMLGGIVVNNAILLVDQANRLRLAGSAPRAAMLEAGRRRLRPVLMTSLTTVLALLPLALGIGEGADAQAPLARAVIGGLVASTLITLLLIPAVYTLVHSLTKGSLHKPSDKPTSVGSS